MYEVLDLTVDFIDTKYQYPGSTLARLPDSEGGCYIRSLITGRCHLLRMGGCGTQVRQGGRLRMGAIAWRMCLYLVSGPSLGV